MLPQKRRSCIYWRSNSWCLIEVLETDFAGNTDGFKHLFLSYEHISIYAPTDVEALYEQPWHFDNTQNVREVLNGMVLKTGRMLT